MSETATIIIDGQSHEFPVIVGSENEKAIDISKLRGLVHTSRVCLTTAPGTHPHLHPAAQILALELWRNGLQHLQVLPRRR